MFEGARKELLGPHSYDMNYNSNDMMEFGNNSCDATAFYLPDMRRAC